MAVGRTVRATEIRRIVGRYFQIFVRERVIPERHLVSTLSRRHLVFTLSRRPASTRRIDIDRYSRPCSTQPETTWPRVDLHNEPGDLHIRPRTH